MSFDGIFFDSGGTIYDEGPPPGCSDPHSSQVNAGAPARAAAALRSLGHRVNEDEVDAHLRALASLPERARPAYTQEDTVAALYERLGLEPRRDEVVYVTGVYSGPRYRSWLFPHVAEVLAALEATGIPMGLIANTGVPGWVMDRNFRGVGLLEYFSVRVYSGDEGMEKPDPRIFDLAAKRAGLTNGKLLYMGDRPEKDMAGARAAGWSSVLFRSAVASSEGAADFEIDSWRDLVPIVTG